MPLYDFKCLVCNKVEEKFCCINDLIPFTIKQRCSICGGKLIRLIGGIKRDWFRPHINEDFNGTPIEVKSKKHLKELCKTYGVTSRAL